ncbi:hypothetical protein F5B22DRAFT_398673 [Xylaria bambusicola]|uniref:uncharacterized protein n=1 Tax=Xylaria bambusicola TaxID=326684 RepID=UPI002007ABED|nr:uncharacterized protein F5B22DRAFT_398673 [Xylaria bambusicola]KAI0508474.1 hypothetical protein F5B22DRAFT_398673 [Xylaria bambusicola]
MPQRSMQERSQIGMSRGKTRSACNRCHQQKLRCIKAAEQSVCERCTRLKIECRYSPRERRVGRSGRCRTGAWPQPRNLAPLPMPDTQQTIPIPGGNECGWLSFSGTGVNNAEGLRYLGSDARSLDVSTSQPYQLTETLDMYSFSRDSGSVLPMISDNQAMTSGVRGDCTFEPLDINSQYNDGPSYVLGYPLTSTTGRLTSLNMALCECASKLPSIEPRRIEPAGSIHNTHVASNNKREAALFALDELFCATNEFITIMKSLCSQANDSEIPNHLTCASATESSRQEMMSTAHIDEATTLLFLSCHCRLADIYESIFKGIRRCLSGSYTATHSIAGVILPQLQVGGFGGVSSPALRVDSNGPPLSPAKISMYLVLTVTLSSQLWTQIRDTMRSCRASWDQVSMTADREVTLGPAWDMAMKRTSRLSRAIEVIQDAL